jgi:hypothetical protein
LTTDTALLEPLMTDPLVVARDALNSAREAVLMTGILRQTGGMLPGVRELVAEAVRSADEARPQIDAALSTIEAAIAQQPLGVPNTAPPAVPEQDAIDAERSEDLGDAAARPGPLSPSDPSPSVSAFGSVPIAAGEVRSAEPAISIRIVQQGTQFGVELFINGLANEAMAQRACGLLLMQAAGEEVKPS